MSWFVIQRTSDNIVRAEVYEDFDKLMKDYAEYVESDKLKISATPRDIRRLFEGSNAGLLVIKGIVELIKVSE